jgi:hypothetical protein
MTKLVVPAQKNIQGKKDFPYWKRTILSYLDSLDGTLQKSRGFAVGTIRTWKGTRYIKMPNNKWRPKYDSQTRGAKMAINVIKHRVDNAKDENELLQIVLENRDRFSDQNGHLLPFVQELSDYVSQRSGKMEISAANEQKKNIERRHKIIRDAKDNGAFVAEEPESQYRYKLYMPDESFLNITKDEFDYATSLKMNKQENDKVPYIYQNSRVAKVSAKIVSIGRKYYTATYPGKTWKFQIEINNENKSWKEGDTVEFYALKYEDQSKYGTRLSYWPVKEEKGKEEKEKQTDYVNKQKIERWLGYIDNRAKEYGSLYQKGADEVKALGIEKYPELNDRYKKILNKIKMTAQVKSFEKWTGYIKENINSYWYNRGEQEALSTIKDMKKLGSDTSKYEKELSDLKNMFNDRSKKQTEEKENKELGGYEGNIISVAKGSGYGGEPYVQGQIIVNPNKEGPKYLYVLSASQKYFREEGMSFGVGDDSGYIYSANTRPATEEEYRPIEEHKKDMAELSDIKSSVSSLASKIQREGKIPSGMNVPEGQTYFDTQNIYGGGSWFVVGKDYIWYVKNNGMDGDSWDENNVRTGGAGAIGWRIPYNESTASQLKEYSEKEKGLKDKIESFNPRKPIKKSVIEIFRDNLEKALGIK